MLQFLYKFQHYILEVLPALIIGFLLSGIIQEFVSIKWVQKRLGKKGITPIFYSTIVGTILPVCCWGSLPIAFTFYKKGSRLGPILAFLVATPATSISALFVSYKLLGLKFTVYIFFSVILMGLIIGLLGNFLKFKPKKNLKQICPHCGEELIEGKHKKKIGNRIKSIFKFAFFDMPKEIGLEIILGLVLAAVVATFIPIGRFINNYFASGWAYLFSVGFGLIMYFCSTASIPLVDAFINQGMNIGAGLVLLIVGPITSYGTILVLRKEFGNKILLFYLISICLLSLMVGYIYTLIS